MKRKIIEFTELQTPDGETFYFDTLDKFMLSEEGLGMPEIEYITQRGPFQHGETAYDYRLEPRILQYVFRENTCSRDNYWAARARLLNMLRPNRNLYGEFNQATLIKTLSNGNQRAIDVLINSGPVFRGAQLGRWDEFSIHETLRFIAHDPTFYDPNLNTETWTLNPDTVDQLEFPFTFDGTDMAFRQYSINEDHVITYTGTWPSFPTITIEGPLISPIITNEDTGEVIYLDYTVETGETVVINLEYGNKSVTSDVRDNIIGTVRSTSYLATFHIAPDPEVADGINTLNVTGGGADGSTTVSLTYYTRYIGI